MDQAWAWVWWIKLLWFDYDQLNKWVNGRLINFQGSKILPRQQRRRYCRCAPRRKPGSANSPSTSTTRCSHCFGYCLLCHAFPDHPCSAAFGFSNPKPNYYQLKQNISKMLRFFYDYRGSDIQKMTIKQIKL